MEFESRGGAQKHFTAYFHETDTDGSGSLSLKEFRNMLRKRGYQFTEAELQSNFSSLDLDGDDSISLEEFVQAMTGIPLVDHRRAMWRKAFVLWDVDNSGDVDRVELKQIFRDVVGRELSDLECERIFLRLDKDKSGKIEWEEFVEYFTNMSKTLY